MVTKRLAVPCASALLWWNVGAVQSAVCPSNGSYQATTFSATDSVVISRMVFMTFPDYPQNLPAWADSLKDEMKAFVQSMSHQKQRLDLRILKPPSDSTKAWCADYASSHYGNDYGLLNREIMFKVKDAFAPNPWSSTQHVMMFQYRNLYPVFGVGGVAYLGFDPQAYPTLGFAGNGLNANTCFFLDDGGSINKGSNRNYVSFNEGHEYGHNVGLPHSPNTDLPGDSYYVNMGRYDCMRGNGGNGVNGQGLLPYGSVALNSAISSWLPDSVITGNVTNFHIKDIRNAAGKVYRINIPNSDQYFLLTNHQGTGFDAKYTGTGLLVWHVRPSVFYDCESAYGKFDNIGPNQTPNPASGKDLLEYDYTRLGDPEDFFDGSPGSFSCSTNPHTYLYAGATPNYAAAQSVPTWLMLTNITVSGTDVVLDVHQTPQSVTAPNGGESKPVGVATNITWDVRSNACVTGVDVALSTDGGSSFTTLAPGLPNSGAYSWTPSTLGTANRVRVVSKDGATTIGTDDSNANFSVFWGIVQSTVAHNSVQALVDSIQVTITWNTHIATTSASDVVKFYDQPSGGNLITPVTTGLTTSNDGLMHEAKCKITPCAAQTYFYYEASSTLNSETVTSSRTSSTRFKISACVEP